MMVEVTVIMTPVLTISWMNLILVIVSIVAHHICHHDLDDDLLLLYCWNLEMTAAAAVAVVGDDHDGHRGHDGCSVQIFVF